ncbi:MAG: pilus assembly protein CpaE [Actinobacteria bacterium]|nr:pilus assembly protein CpaE [Actinomycetota bacterium]
MLTVATARRLDLAGLRWTPAPGDRFVLPDRGMDEEVFVISDMTVEVHRFPNATVIGFNGTTEWALDSVEQHEALWLPAEHQLRELLGGLFRALRRDGEGWAVVLALPDAETGPREHVVTAASAEEAYGLALVDVLEDVASRV